jgi:hypothetical protein
MTQRLTKNRPKDIPSTEFVFELNFLELCLDFYFYEELPRACQ